MLTRKRRVFISGMTICITFLVSKHPRTNLTVTFLKTIGLRVRCEVEREAAVSVSRCHVAVRKHLPSAVVHTLLSIEHSQAGTWSTPIQSALGCNASTTLNGTCLA